MKKSIYWKTIRFDRLINHQLKFYNLGDDRLNERCKKIHYKISENGASNSFPDIVKDHCQLKALYNFMNNKKVTPEKIQSGTTKGLIDYFANEDNLSYHFIDDDLPNYLYNVQDTTYGKYHGRKSLELGYIETLHDNGIVIHSDVLMDSHHIPLGLSCQQFIIRDKSEFGLFF